MAGKESSLSGLSSRRLVQAITASLLAPLAPRPLMHSGPWCCCRWSNPQILFQHPVLPGRAPSCLLAMTKATALAANWPADAQSRYGGVVSVSFACARSFPSRIPSTWSTRALIARPARQAGHGLAANAYFWWASNQALRFDHNLLHG